MKPKTKRQAGFSVIEVLITLFMVGVTLMLFQATANSIVLNKYGRYREVALRIADQKIQTVRTTSFASIPASGSFSDPQLSLIPSGAANLTVTDINDDLKDVQVIVTWRSPNNNSTQQIQLQTYVSRGGLGQ
jgi:Tfp pilus assembly protein PilV